MRRQLLLIAAVALAATSCSNGTDTTSLPPEPSSTTATAQTAPDVSTTAATAPEAVPPETEAPTETTAPIEGPPAPDFTMTLDDGSEFTLSAEQKPVYLVFWAEW